jgi:hypothetical protein
MHVTAPIMIASLPERFLASYDHADREGYYLTRIRLTRVEATRLVDYLADAPADHTGGRLSWDGDVLIYTDLHPDEATTVIRYEADTEGRYEVHSTDLSFVEAPPDPAVTDDAAADDAASDHVVSDQPGATPEDGRRSVSVEPDFYLVSGPSAWFLDAGGQVCCAYLTRQPDGTYAPDWTDTGAGPDPDADDFVREHADRMAVLLVTLKTADDAYAAGLAAYNARYPDAAAARLDGEATRDEPSLTTPTGPTPVAHDGLIALVRRLRDVWQPNYLVASHHIAAGIMDGRISERIIRDFPRGGPAPEALCLGIAQRIGLARFLPNAHAEHVATGIRAVRGLAEADLGEGAHEWHLDLDDSDQVRAHGTTIDAIRAGLSGLSIRSAAQLILDADNRR